jgi:TM2 domain-containing membrane protein YozV
MQTPHKNKTLATLLSSLFGAFGVHRFYLRGKRDRLAWLHVSTLPISILYTKLFFNLPLFVTASPLMLSALAGLFEALILGLMSDEKWDVKFNAHSGKKSDSEWPLALVLVLTLAIGATALITVLARGFDLLYTGGAYG